VFHAGTSDLTGCTILEQQVDVRQQFRVDSMHSRRNLRLFDNH
jgi:hypothetical protein